MLKKRVKRLITRPISITIIAWCLLIFSFVYFAFTLTVFVGFSGAFYHFPSYRDLINYFGNYQQGFGTILPLTHIINIISSVGIFKKKNWARFLGIMSVFLATTFTIANIFAGWLHCSFICWIQTVGFTFCVIYFLLNKKANQYFTGNPNQWFLTH